MKKAILAAIAAVMALMMFVGCSEETGVVSNPVASQDLVRVNGSNQVPIFAGQNTMAGTVTVTVDNNAYNGDGCVNVRYETTGGWEIVEAHLWAGTVFGAYPQTRNGNPIPGQFPYTSGNVTGATSWEYCIPLSVFGMNAHNTSCDPVTAYIAAHAALRHVTNGVVDRQETGWAGGQRFVSRGNWATWFSVTLECYQESTPPPPPVATCETAFAKSATGSTCFIGTWTEPDGDQFTVGSENGNGRWGWTNGPLALGSYTFDVYAGAAHCDISGMQSVGTVSVVYDGSQATVTYTMAPGFSMDETHVYVGSNPLPAVCTGGNGPNRNCDYTVAPGQYGNTHDLTNATSDVFTVTGLSGNIYVVAHAVVCSNNW